MTTNNLTFVVRGPGLVLVKHEQEPIALLLAVAADARINKNKKEYVVLPLAGPYEKKFKGMDLRQDSYQDAKQAVIQLFQK